VKAVVYDGPRQVNVTDVPDARVERPTDVLVRITTTNICVTAASARATRRTTPTGTSTPTTDGKITTSRSPDDLPAFCDTILQEFASGTGG
jgi:threonine dehydrogenase-like Zn-dependent dehydrogenase